jgi:hypothetical protein
MNARGGPLQRAPRGWLLLFCLILLVWEPLSLARLASVRIAALVDRPLALAVLLIRVAVTGVGIGAGIALWAGRPAGPFLAKAYLVASSLVTVMVLGTRWFPSSLLPGTALPLAVATIAANLAWFLYLGRSRQVAQRCG